MSAHEQPADPGDPSAVLGRLVAHHREFLAFLQARVGSRAVAEDILQEAFVRSIDRLGDLRNGESAIAWFYRILRNSVIDRQRRDAAMSRRLTALAAELDETVDPSTELHGAVCRCVGRLAETLKPEYADALRRIELHGVAVKDYAVEAGITRGNAAVRAFRAREALKKQVMRSCGKCAEHGCVDCSCGDGEQAGS